METNAMPGRQENDKKAPASPEDRPPIVVAIGASAGGIRALQALFGDIPERTGAAFIVVVHLDPEHRSELPAILGTRTPLPVVQVNGRVKLRADHVYVIPPDQRLQLVDHQVATAAFDEPRGHRAPIDLFFRSMADRLGDGFAVVLSGAGSDGALGVRAVKEAGGIILVQDPAEAEFGSMPRSAISTRAADFVLPVRDLTQRLVELIRLKQNAPPVEAPPADEDVVRQILAHLRVRTGHDFLKYKRSTVVRRIARRMQVTRTGDLGAYHEVLRESGEEAQALLADLLISVTSFFRDPEVFEVLGRTVLPQLFEARDARDPMRIWVPGCATGEEAYTIAMLVLEEAGRHAVRPSIQVFGSDLDARALGIAREGRYPAAIETDVSEERLRRFFARDGDGYRVRQELRDTVLFAVHDLLKDPPFSRVDLVSCRNLLIYLDRELQEQVCSTFNYALNPGGFLLLGVSETADNPPALFRPLDRTSRIYRSAKHAGDRPPLLPGLLGALGARDHGPASRSVPSAAALSDAAVHLRAIERVAPPSLLVDESHRVVHLSENVGRYLQPSGGPLSGDVVDLVRPELRFELRSALHRLFEQSQPTLSLPIAVRFNGTAQRVLLQVKPSGADPPAERLTAVVMFIEGDAFEDPSDAQDPTTHDTVRRLVQELELTQARLRTVREESDAATEELRAANEELQSINEEYRSTSEELETSKEELQSINEELQTVNSELKLKLEAISRAHSDLQNLMAATDFGTLFLDGDLRIKRFTDQVRDLFSITPLDEGRPITDFSHQLDYDDLVVDARTVLAERVPIRREVRGRDGRCYEVRLRPYRTMEDQIDGVVITFLDVTEQQKVEAALRRSERGLRRQLQLVELSHDPIFVWDFDDGIMEWNRGSEQLYGYSRDEALGAIKSELLKTVVPDASFEAVRIALLRDGGWTGELEQTTKDGRKLTVESRLHLEVVDDQRLVLETTRDITDRKRWERRQQLLLRELAHRVKNTLAVVQSIARQTLRKTASPADFMASLEGRLSALSKAHDLLLQSNWNGATLDALARLQLEPYTASGPGRLRIDGPPVSLPADIATPFALVLHELAANAAKYGSLSKPSGSLSVTWTIRGEDDENVLDVIWHEESGRPVKAFKATGLGMVLIDQAIPESKVSRDFGSTGFFCRIEVMLPAENLDQTEAG